MRLQRFFLLLPAAPNWQCTEPSLLQVYTDYVQVLHTAPNPNYTFKCKYCYYFSLYSVLVQNKIVPIPHNIQYTNQQLAHTNSFFLILIICTFCESIQLKKDLLRHFKEGFQFLRITEVQCMYYTHQSAHAVAMSHKSCRTSKPLITIPISAGGVVASPPSTVMLQMPWRICSTSPSNRIGILYMGEKEMTKKAESNSII